MNKAIQVRVTRPNGICWYSHHVGQVFSVRSVYDDLVVLVNAPDGYTNIIYPSDYEMVQESLEPKVESVRITGGVFDWQIKHKGLVLDVLRKTDKAVWVRAPEPNQWYYLTDVEFVN